MKYHKQMKEKFVNYADKIINKRKNFFNSFDIFNNKTGVVLSKNYDYLYHLKNDYLYYNFVSKAMNEIYLQKKGYIALFLTVTLDSIAHKYKINKKGKMVLNKKYNSKFTINRGYQVLNKFFRHLYKNFRIKSKYKSFDFVKVFEPHSDFTPHLHSIIYIKETYLKSFFDFIDNSIAKNNFIGRYEVEILNNISRANSYLMKYIQKSFIDSMKENDLKMFLGWRLKNKIRMFTASQKLHFRGVFNKFGFSNLAKRFLLDEDLQDKYNTKNLYTLYSKIAVGNIKIKEKEKLVNNKTVFLDWNCDKIISFNIEKERIRKVNKLYKKYLDILFYFDDIDTQINFLENGEIKGRFEDFLFYEAFLSFEEFKSILDKKKLIDDFIEFLQKNLFFYYYRIVKFEVNKASGYNCWLNVYNKEDYSVVLN